MVHSCRIRHLQLLFHLGHGRRKSGLRRYGRYFTHWYALIMRELFDLSGKVALVTGSTHGLGMAMAKALAKSGATLVVAGNTPEKMDNAIKRYAENKIVAYGYLFDVSDETAVDQHISTIEKD